MSVLRVKRAGGRSLDLIAIDLFKFVAARIEFQRITLVRNYSVRFHRTCQQGDLIWGFKMYRQGSKKLVCIAKRMGT